jgi:release factor glutamine methyltransferase
LREEVDAPGFDELLARRQAYDPLAYILGEWEFFALRFKVRAPLLVPRPETEHLVEAALEFLSGRRPGVPGPRNGGRVLDLCTGTGCVAVALAVNAPRFQYTATDLRPEALSTAAENARLHGVDLALHLGDLYGALPKPETSRRFAAVVSNPPYVAEAEYAGLSPVIRRHEDPGALLAGIDGLDCIRRIVAGAPVRLAPGGLLALETGETQTDAVSMLLRAAGFHDIRTDRDLAGHPRIVSGILAGAGKERGDETRH